MYFSLFVRLGLRILLMSFLPLSAAMAGLSTSYLNNSLNFHAICSSGGQNCSPQQKKILDQISWTCQLELKNHRCDELVEKNPQWAPLIRKCHVPDICEQAKTYHQQQAQACLRGYKNALVDMGVALKDTAVSLGELIDKTWDGYLQERKDTAVFIEKCEKSISCKRQLAQQITTARAPTDTELAKMSAKTLWQNARNSRVSDSYNINNRIKSRTEAKQLTDAQVEKIKVLKTVVSDSLGIQYDRYNCYNELAQAELECYAMGTLVDPLMVAGYFVKGARALTAMKSLPNLKKTDIAIEPQGSVSKSVTEPVNRSNVKPVTKSGNKSANKSLTRKQLTAKYLHYIPTSAGENQKWMALASKGPSADKVFYDVENSQLKLLNDTLKDKNLVTSLTNLHKEITFGKIDELIQKNPGLEVSKYSDFKSSRFAFSGKIPKDLQKQLDGLFNQANKDFQDIVTQNQLLRESDKTQNWFRAGIGQSADQANLAARYSRSTSGNTLQNFSSPAVTKQLQSKLVSMDTQREELTKKLSGTGLAAGKSFDTDVFDIVRKGDGNIAQIRSSLMGRYGLGQLSEGIVRDLDKYVKATDEFSPGIHVSQRLLANFEAAPAGGLSADIIGMGGANLKATADSLAGSKNLDEALLRSRAAEKEVTANFARQKKYFEEVLKDSVAPGKLKTVCSGDDCVARAVKPLSPEEKHRIINRFAQSEYSGSYRLAFVNNGIKNSDIKNNLATHGESVEKILRKSLGTQIEPRKLKGLTFAIDMQTKELNRGNLKLILGQNRNASLSDSERKLIENEFKNAVQQFNQDLKAGGIKSPSYKAIP